MVGVEEFVSTRPFSFPRGVPMCLPQPVFFAGQISDLGVCVRWAVAALIIILKKARSEREHIRTAPSSPVGHILTHWAAFFAHFPPLAGFFGHFPPWAEVCYIFAHFPPAAPPALSLRAPRGRFARLQVPCRRRPTTAKYTGKPLVTGKAYRWGLKMPTDVNKAARCLII